MKLATEGQAVRTAADAGAGCRIVMATFGSLGDLHPYIALGRGLRCRGHSVVIATSSLHRAKVEGEGLEFHAVRPELSPGDDGVSLLRQVMDARTGSEFVIRRLMMPAVREQYEDLAAAVSGADLLLSHPLTYAAPLLGEKLGMPWVATVLQPSIMGSAYEPPVPAHMPGFARLYRFGPRFNRHVLRLIQRATRDWYLPVEELRVELGLPRRGCPLFEAQFSPHLNLALFSHVLGEPQPDWPARTLVTGFPFYDRQNPGEGMAPELEAFLEAGPAPLVFTLGSSAVMVGGDFYVHAAEAARRLGKRAVLLVGEDGWNRLPDPLPSGVFACRYAPHGDLFPRAAAVVHQGGVGTTGQALRSGRPMVVVPYAHDQPDHALRISRLGVGTWVPQRRWSADTAVRALRAVLESPRYAARAAEIGRIVAAEDGVETACGALESLLERTRDYRSARSRNRL